MKVLTVFATPSLNVPVTGDETRRGYLERAYQLGKDFAR
jgi:hypothetical protein